MADPSTTAHDVTDRVQTLLKAVVVEAQTDNPKSRPGGEDLAAAFGQAGAIEPPYDPEAARGEPA